MAAEAHLDAIIREHIGYSMLAASIPIPLVDVGAVTAVQLDMIKKIAAAEGVKYDHDAGKAMASSLASASLARYGASALKAVPGFGTLLGGAAQVVLSGATTYALGSAFVCHFQEGGCMQDLKARDLGKVYEATLEKGREVAQKLWSKAETEREGIGLDGVADAIERLASLRDAGSISDEEFSALKRVAIERA